MGFNSVIDRTDADALIPEDTVKEIIMEMPKQSAALQMFKQVPLSTKTTRQRVLSTLPMAYFVNGDTGLKQTTEAAWSNKYHVAEEIAVIVPIPENVIDDADIDIWAELKPLVVEAFGQKIDAAVFFGIDKPSTWGESVVDHADTAGNEIVRGAGVDLADDISDVMSLVEADGYSVNGFVARNSIKGSLRGLRDENGGLLFQPSLQAGTPAQLYGEPLAYLENGGWQNSLADLIALNRNNGIIGIRKDITFKMFDSGVISDDEGNIIYNLMQQDMQAMRVVMRLSWQVANPVTRLNGGGTRSPFGVLRPTGWS